MKSLLSLVIILCAGSVAAQPGTLDKSFADSGIALYKNITGIINKIALQSDGKIIGAGGGALNDTIPCLLIRYNTDGSIDDSFGTDGDAGYNDMSVALDIIVESRDDEIIALGRTAVDVQLVKYKKDGARDSSFGLNGSVITSAGANDVPTAIAMQSDRKIIVCGYIINEPNEAREGFLIRYLPDGNLDKGFGTNGILIFGEVQGNVTPVQDVAVLPNDQILVALNLNVNVVYRFNADGSRDYSFGNNGIGFLPAANEDVKAYVSNSLVVRSDGKIITAGIAYNKKFNPTKEYLAVSCLNADGSKDSSFGNGGLQHVVFGNGRSEGTDVLLQDDDKIIIIGRTYDDFQTYSHLVLARFHGNGKIDSAFGNDGQVVTEVEGYAVGKSALLQKDKKVVLAGDTFIGDFFGHAYFLMARYNNDSTKKQILIAKIRRWLQHHNGIVWDDVPGVKNYSVQRSSNGVRWTTVHSQQSTVNGKRSAVNHYNDASPLPGTNYYRLQITGTNGVVAYSNVIAISNEQSAISISPNPARNVLHIEGLPSSAKINITVVDLAGNVACSVQLEPVPTQSGANSSSYNLNVNKLKPGNYLLRIEAAEGVVTKQFVKE